MTIQLRRDTAANWTSVNPVLANGQPGYDTTNKVFKIGDGTTAWASLTAIGGFTDHGALSGLSDDDHTQYHNNTRGDVRYYTKTLLDAGQLDTRYYTETEVDALIAGVGGIARVIVNTSGSATLDAAAYTDYAVFITGAHNQTMPTAVGNENKYDIKNNHLSNVTILTTSSQTIDGATTISLSPQSAVTLISNGSNWSIF